MPLPITRYLSQVGDGLIRLLYPTTCWACGRFFPDCPARLCPGCAQLLADDPHATCPRCASTIGPFTDQADGCFACRGEALAFELALRLGPYQGLLREVILRLKNSLDENLADIIGTLWAEQLAPRLRDLGPQAVVPVPLHWTRRYWERGFNQSEVLARCLAKTLRIPCYPYCIRRLRRTPRQTRQVSPAARRENVRGAFQARGRHDLTGKTVILVDDVMTTGATANEVARTLQALKPARIVVAVLARAS